MRVIRVKKPARSFPRFFKTPKTLLKVLAENR